MCLHAGVAGPGRGSGEDRRTWLESQATAGESPLAEIPTGPTGIPSRAEHVKLRLNPGGPPSKAEY